MQGGGSPFFFLSLLSSSPLHSTVLHNLLFLHLANYSPPLRGLSWNRTTIKNNELIHTIFTNYTTVHASHSNSILVLLVQIMLLLLHVRLSKAFVGFSIPCHSHIIYVCLKLNFLQLIHSSYFTVHSV